MQPENDVDTKLFFLSTSFSRAEAMFYSVIPLVYV